MSRYEAAICRRGRLYLFAYRAMPSPAVLGSIHTGFLGMMGPELG